MSEIVLNQPFAVPEKCIGCPGLQAINAQIGHYGELLEDKHGESGRDHVPVHEDEVHMGALEHTASRLHQQASILVAHCTGFDSDDPEQCQSPDIVESRLRTFDGDTTYFTED